MLLNYLTCPYFFQQASPYFNTLDETQASSNLNSKSIILNTGEPLHLHQVFPVTDELLQAPWLLTWAGEPCSHC